MRRLFCIAAALTLLTSGRAFPAHSALDQIPINSRSSIVHVGGISIGETENGKKAAQLLIEALDDKNPAHAGKALELFREVVPDSTPGGEYTALKWFCNSIIDPEAAQRALAGDDLAKGYYDYFTKDDYAALREYLERQFRLGKPQDQDPELARMRWVFLDFLIVLNSPTRHEWEKTDEVLKIVGLKPGMRIADVGCGPGFYAYRFAKAVGEDGRVYAVDTMQESIDYLYDFARARNLDNLITIKSRNGDIMLQEKVDAVFMSSVYQLVYNVMQEGDRRSLIDSIRRALKDGGRLIIVDNGPVAKPAKPYPGCFVEKTLVITQLEHFGFELESDTQIVPQRYVLTFRKTNRPPDPAPKTVEEIKPDSGISLVHIGSLDSFDITPLGIQAAGSLLTAIEDNQPEMARKAYDLYTKLIPNENFGGEYTALQWFAKYLITPAAERKTFFDDPLSEAYFHFFADDDFAVLREYITHKYKLRRGMAGDKEVDPEVGFIRRAFLEDFILFNNPRREEWEKTSEILELLPLKKGQTVLDIGSGPGYYTYRFSKMVGDTGRVHAIDIKQEHLDFLNEFLDDQGIKNVTTTLSRVDDVVVTGPVDLAYMCSLYHVIYAVASDEEREPFVESIHRALKKDGKLVIVDNGPVPVGELPYHGPYIAKELIIGQLEKYGFILEKSYQTIPQRYMLVFRKV